MPNSKNAPLILASASPNRLELLKSVNITPDKVSPSDIDETPLRSENPRDFVKRLAREKALVAADKHKNSFIIAADTIAVTGGKIIGKAETEGEARKTLLGFSGRRHKVLTGLCIISPEGKISTRCIVTVVKFKKLEKKELDDYLKSKQWVGKSGCYGLQSRAGGFVESINGSFSSVIGFPLAETRKILSGMGYKL